MPFRLVPGLKLTTNANTHKLAVRPNIKVKYVPKQSVRTNAEYCSDSEKDEPEHFVQQISKVTASVDIANTDRVGDRVTYTKDNKQYNGTIRFIGYLKGCSGLWIGVELDEAVGESNGTFNGDEVFKTGTNKALFSSFPTQAANRNRTEAIRLEQKNHIIADLQKKIEALEIMNEQLVEQTIIKAVIEGKKVTSIPPAEVNRK